MDVNIQKVIVEAKPGRMLTGIRTVVHRRGKKMVYYWSWRLEAVQDYDFIDEESFDQFCKELIQEINVS